MINKNGFEKKEVGLIKRNYDQKMILKKHIATTMITIEFKNDDYDHLVFHDKKIFLSLHL